jgi:predicted ATPase
MLEEFTVDNFKSLINVSFRPREQNLLLGMNNAGKTNLCQALRFLSGTTRLPLAECADQTAGGVPGLQNFSLRKPTIDFGVRAAVPFEGESLSFDYRLSVIPRSTTTGEWLGLHSERLYVTGAAFDNTLLLEDSGRHLLVLDERDARRGQETPIHVHSPRDRTALFNVWDSEETARANCFKKYIASWQYYALSVAALRGFDHLPGFTVLNTNGNNLASVVYQLKTENERGYRRLLTHLRTVEPSVDVINFHVPAKDKVFMVFEDKNGNQLPAGSASSGTLRYLALLYVLAVQPQGEMGSLRIIEEPENGIYVGYLKHLLALASEADPPQQLIFTSHSPYFIDLFDDRLDSIFVLKGGQQHSTVTQPDPELVRKRLEKFPLGEQHFQEMLG